MCPLDALWGSSKDPVPHSVSHLDFCSELHRGKEGLILTDNRAGSFGPEQGALIGGRWEG